MDLEYHRSLTCRVNPEEAPIVASLMTRRPGMGRALGALLLCLAFSAAAEEQPAEFTATYRYSSKVHPGPPVVRKLYVGSTALRLDNEEASEGFVVKDRQAGTAVEVDLKHSTRERISKWSGWPYEVVPGQSPCRDRGTPCVRLMTKVRNGRKVETWKETNPSCRKCETSFVSVDRTLGFEIRREIVGIELHELRNIRTGAPPAQLLELPRGLRDPSMPDGAEAAECTRQDGKYARRGLRGFWVCDRPTKDAGKVCSNSDECEARLCVAPKGAAVGTKATGTCFGRTVSLSTCLAGVSNGVVGHTLCVD